jgi:hypothetical protein
MALAFHIFIFHLFPLEESSFYVDAILSWNNTWAASYQDFSFNFKELKLEDNDCQVGDILTWKPSSEMGTFKCESIYKDQSVICIGILPQSELLPSTKSLTSTTTALASSASRTTTPITTTLITTTSTSSTTTSLKTFTSTATISTIITSTTTTPRATTSTTATSTPTTSKGFIVHMPIIQTQIFVEFLSCSF